MGRYRVKPSKPVSALGVFVGIILVGIGISIAIPAAGLFGILWTLVAAAITISNAVNLFSERGIAGTEIDVDGSHPSSFDDRLRRLHKLRDDGLITAEQFDLNRAELLNERW